MKFTISVINITQKERDMILKVTWDKQGYPADVLQVLEITNVYEMQIKVG